MNSFKRSYKIEMPRADFLALFFGALMFCHVGPVSAGVTRSTAAQISVVEIGWFAQCHIENEAPLFSVTIDGKGTVRFQGGDETYQKGLVTAHIPVSRARKIIATTERESRSVPSASTDGIGRATRYCLRISIPDRNTRWMAYSPDDKSDAIHRVQDVLQHSVDVKNWLCPLREERIVGSGYCDPYRIKLVLSVEGACKASHVVNFYDDGTMHYFIAAERGGDVYMHLSKEALSALSRKASNLKGQLIVSPRSSERKESAIVESRPTYSYFVENEEVSEFARQVQGLTNLEWKVADMECRDSVATQAIGTVTVRN